MINKPPPFSLNIRIPYLIMGLRYGDGNKELCECPVQTV